MRNMIGAVACVRALMLSGCALYSTEDTGVDAASDADAAVTPPDAAPSPVPLLRYRLDGDTANDGSLAPQFPGALASASFVPGVHGQAARFGGTPSSVLSIAGTAGLLSTRGQLTIALWFRDGTEPATNPLVAYLIDNRCCPMTTDRGFQSYHGVSGAPLTTCSVGGCATVTYPIGPWHHLLYRYDASAGARLEIFIDGAPVGTIANPQAEPIFGPGLGDLRIGFNTFFAVDDLVVYDRVFTDADQCALVTGGTWTGAACTLPATPSP